MRPFMCTRPTESIISWPPRSRSDANLNRAAARRGLGVEGHDAVGADRQPAGLAAFSPRIEAHALDDRACRIRDCVDGAQMIAMQIFQSRRRVGNRRDLQPSMFALARKAGPAPHPAEGTRPFKQPAGYREKGGRVGRGTEEQARAAAMSREKASASSVGNSGVAHA